MDVISKDTVEMLRRELATAIDRLADGDGSFPTAIDGLELIRASAPSEPIALVHEPSVCLIAQGSKQMLLSDELYQYDSSRCLLIAVDLPVVAQVLEASPRRPYLSVRLGLNSVQIGSLLTDTSLAEGDLQEAARKTAPMRGISVGRVDMALLGAAVRLVRLLESPQHIPVLAPLVQREILYLLLVGEQGAALRQIARTGGEMEGIVQSLHRLKEDFAKTLRMDALAREVHMSPSQFHLHFKAVTAMTPLQYQKRLRLLEARRLMLREAVDAATACYQVGYESPSQFSREYHRLFGDAPRRDTARLRDAP